jgi:hypothetical protein
MAPRIGFEESLLEEIFGSPPLRQQPQDRWEVSFSEYQKSFGNHAIKLLVLPASGEFTFSLSIGGHDVLSIVSAHQTGSYAEIKDGQGYLILKDFESEYVTTIRVTPDLYIGQSLGSDTP